MKIKRTKVLFLAVLLLKINIAAQELLTFDFSGYSGNETTTTSSTNHPNLEEALLHRGSGLIESKNKNRFNAKHWNTGPIQQAITENDYMEFSIIPKSQCTLHVTSITFNIQRSLTGPRTIAIRSSLDTYETSIGEAQNIQDTANTQQLTFTINQTVSSSPISYRIYMYHAESSAGSAGFEGTGNDIVVNGTVLSNTTNPVVSFITETTYITEPNTTFITSIPLTITNFSAAVSIAVSAEASSTTESEDYVIHTPEITFTTKEVQHVKIELRSDRDIENETLVLNITITSGTADIEKKTHYIHILDKERPLQINEILADPSSSEGDANGDGISNTSEDEFVEIYNASGTALDISNWVLADAVRDRHVFPAGTIIPVEETIVVFGGGIPITVPGIVQIASSGSLGLNNGSDTVVIKDNFGTEILKQGYSISGNIDQSIAREADLIGVFNKHTAIKSNPKNFSPGRYNTSNRSFSPVIKWTGETNENWNTESNWIDDILPQQDDIIEIPSGLAHYPTAIEPIEFSHLRIKPGASFIAKKETKGLVKFEQNLNTTNWYLTAVPVAGERITTLINNHIFATGKDGNIGIAFYKSIENKWDYQTINSNRELKGVEGFAVKLATPGKLSFSGNISTVPVTHQISSASNSFHLIGNPYTSYINLGEFLNDNKEALEEQTIWVWNPTTSNYELKMAGTNSAFQIAPSQGFFVKTIANSTIFFAKDNQGHQGNTNGKQKRAEVLLTLCKDSHKTTTKILFIKGCTNDFDNGYDGTVFTGANNSTILYTQLASQENKKKLSIQSVAFSSLENSTIPLGVNANKNETIIFSASKNNIPEAVQIYIEDRHKKTYANLTNKNYSIKLEENTYDTGRFYIHIISNTLVTEDAIINSKTFQIHQTNPQELTLTNVATGTIKLSLYSGNGSHIKSVVLNTDGTCKIYIPRLSSGLYFLNVNSKKGEICKKFIIK